MLCAQSSIVFGFEELLFPCQLVKISEALARERLRRDGCAYRATGLALMLAVTELATRCKFLDVAERAADSIGRIPQL
jgi:hypothetical protein